jgi:hypothetical protein
MKSLMAFCLIPTFVAMPAIAGQQIIGNPDFVHLIKDKGTWWFADHTGKRFITTGMNHVDEGKILFNEVNEGWLRKEFGKDIKAPSANRGPIFCPRSRKRISMPRNGINRTDQ